MTRNLRRRHLVAWLLLGPVILAAATLAIVARPDRAPVHEAAAETGP